MKRIILFLCLCLCVLAGCSVADADLILQNGSSEQVTESDGSDAFIGSGAQSDDSVDSSDTTTGSENASEESGSSADTAETETVCVYVCGAVNAPGVYELSAESRIYQAVELAGGLSEDADEKSVNLAEIIADGQMIWIPTVEDAQSGQAGAENSSVSENVSLDARVNINTATVEELTGLNGIGETKAEAIVAYREAHGGFQSTDEIMQVDGIGEGTYQKIQDDIRVE